MKNLKCLAIVIVSILCLNTQDIRSQNLQDLTVAKMIPLPLNEKTHPYIRIKSDNFKIPAGYDFSFDTGSADLCMPYENLTTAFANTINTDASNIYRKWDRDAYKVTGTFKFYSQDGTEYQVENFDFYVYKPGEASSLSETRKFIAGAFPINGSITYELAEINDPTKIGFGVYSDTPSGNINDNWLNTNLYLQIGEFLDMNSYSQIKWRGNNLPGFQGCCPEAIGGFRMKINFPNSQNEISTGDMIATIDTGFDNVSTRIDDTDPQNNPPYSQYFADSQYDAGVKFLRDNAQVTIYFTASDGTTSSYSFPSIESQTVYKVNRVVVGPWNGSTPLASGTPTQPHNRMFLGNSIHYYCPMVFWDITGQRVGIGFKTTALQQNCTTCQEGLTLLKDNMYKYPEKANISNGGRRPWTEVFQDFITNNYPACIEVGNYVKANPTAAINTIYTESTVGNWDQLFQSHVGILTHGTRIPAYCPYAHRGQYNCLEASRRMLEISIPAVERIIDEVE